MYDYFHLASSGYLIVIMHVIVLVINTVPNQNLSRLCTIFIEVEEGTRF